LKLGALSQVGGGVKTMKSGAMDFLTKPVSDQTLLDAVGPVSRWMAPAHGSYRRLAQS
jgi:FixJ family two-component response regulator